MKPPPASFNDSRIRPMALSGKTVVITRALAQAQDAKRVLEAFGAQVLMCPMVCIEPAVSPEDLEAVFNQVQSYDWLVFTSANGVAYTMTLMEACPSRYDALRQVRIAAVGSSTVERLQQYGLKADIVPQVYTGQALVQSIRQVEPNLVSKRLLLLRSDIARPDIPQLLQKLGAHVDDVVVYRTRAAIELSDLAMLKQQLEHGGVDAITFASPSAVKSFTDVFAPDSRQLERVVLAAVGPVTGQALSAHLGRVDVIAPVHTMMGLAQALADYFQGCTQMKKET